MSFLTLDRARSATAYRGYQSLASAELRKAAAATRSTDRFDVFLSHTREDADVIYGIKRLMENRRLTVYVDWIEDPQLDRSHVTADTAEVLRARMRQCTSLVFATSESSPNSKWMPWELGYFDGYKPGHVAILPLVATSGATFVGQEYLGLYPYLEDLSFTDGDRSLGLSTGQSRGRPLESLMTSGFRL